MSRHATWALAVILACVLGAPTGSAEAPIDLFDGRDASSWSSARGPLRLSQEFERYDFTSVQGDPPYLLWRFQTRELTYSDLHAHREVERPFRAVRVRVANDGPAFALCLKLLDRSGAEWAPRPRRVDAKQDWTTLEFPYSDFAVASWSQDPDGRLDFPAAALAVIAFDVVPREDYAVRIGSVELVPYPAPKVDVRELVLPAQIGAGEDFGFAARMVRLSDDPLPPGPVELRFVQDGQLRLRLPIAVDGVSDAAWPMGGELALSAALHVPRYAWPGRQDLRLAIGGVEAETVEGTTLGETVVNVPDRTPTAACVRLWRGAPALHINGKPHPGMALACYTPSVETYRQFSQAGVNLFSFAATPSESAYGLSKTCWVAPGRFDYSQFDERAAMVLEANPDAYFFPRLYLYAPEWWTEQNPDDLVYFDPGDGQLELFLLNGRTKTPSWASDRWREDTAAALRRFIDHVEASPYAERCIGYHIASGTTEEWMMWGSNEDQWVDYGPANTAGFRAWLRDRYHSDLALQTAWRQPAVTLDTVSVPTRAQRSASEHGVFRDPASAQCCIDYCSYTSWLVADTIRYLAAVVKEHAGPNRIVGTFYGYTLQLFEQRQQNAGHLALRQLWESPDIGFICSPTSYAFREVGGRGVSHVMSLLGGVQLHGKLWFSETDVRTSLTPGEVGMWGRPETVEEDCLQQDKELGRIITQGIAHWWFDVGGIRYDHPMLMERIAGWCRAAGRAADASRDPVDEIAVIIDPRSFAFLKVGDPVSPHLILHQVAQLARVGTPVAYYTLDDLDRLAPRRMYVFLGCFAPTAEQRSQIDRLKADGRLLLFVYANGVFRNDEWTPDAMAELTGIQTAWAEGPASLRVRVLEALGPDAAGIEYGAADTPGPLFWCADESATTLGVLTDGRTGLALRDQGTWIAAHSAAPTVPAQVLRALAEKAGVHVYIDTYDVLWARRGTLAVSVVEGGTRHIRLPEPANVTDVYTGRAVAADADSFAAELAPLSTTTWRLDPTR